MAAPWYFYMATVHHDLLFETFLGEGNLGRFVSPEHVWFTGYYVAVLAAGFLPWSGALPASLIAAGRRSAWAGEKGSGTTPGPLFELCWFGSVVGVFSLSASKLPSYLLPPSRRARCLSRATGTARSGPVPRSPAFSIRVPASRRKGRPARAGLHAAAGSSPPGSA